MESERDRGEQTDFGVRRFVPYLKQAVIEVDVEWLRAGFVVDVNAFDDGDCQPAPTFKNPAAIRLVLLPVVSTL